MRRPAIQIWTGVCLAAVLVLGPASSLQAGMPVIDFNDVVRLRLEEISFFLASLLVCGLVLKFLWNYALAGLAPRLKYRQALSMTFLFGLVMLLILTMISGIREVLTPGAWSRQGATYRLNAPAMEFERRRSLEHLRHALFEYARSHEGRFPHHDFVPEIPSKLWESPDHGGSHYIYSGGLTTGDSEAILAVEPISFGNERYCLLTSGQIQVFGNEEIKRRLQSRVSDE